MISQTQIAQASRPELLNIKQDLVLDKMKMDKFFSIFLDENELEEDTSSPEWVTYKEMTKRYEKVSTLINVTDYYLNENV